MPFLGILPAKTQLEVIFWLGLFIKRAFYLKSWARIGSELGADALELGADALELGADALELGADALELGADALELGADALELGADALELPITYPYFAKTNIITHYGKKSLIILGLAAVAQRAMGAKKDRKSDIFIRPSKILPRLRG